MSKYTAIGIAFLALAGFVPAGCGGGAGGGSASAPSTGRVQVTLQWGEGAARQVPTNAASVRVTIMDPSGNVLQSRIFVRPSDGNLASSETFDLPQGILKVHAEAFPTFDATGTPQADFQTNATVVGGRLDTLNLSFGSTIAYVAIKPDSIPLSGTPVPVNAVAFDAQNNPVLSSEWEWSNSDPSVIKMESNGANATLFAIGPGKTTITVKELGSGKTFGRIFNVAPLQ